MTERRGHIKVSRRFFEQDAWWNEPRRFSKAEAWIDCIQMASWRPRRYAIGLEVQNLQRGEFMASLRYLAKRWRWGKTAVNDFLKALEKSGRISGQREGQGGTVYLLVKYDLYQSNDTRLLDTKADRSPDTSRTPPGHLPDKTEAVKQLSSKESLSDEEQSVVDFYRETHPRRLRGEVPVKTLRLLRAALEHYGVGDLRSAISGNAASQFHRDNNHMGLDLILRDANKIDYFMGIRETAAKEADTVEMTDDFGVMRLHRRNGNGEWEVVK